MKKTILIMIPVASLVAACASTEQMAYDGDAVVPGQKPIPRIEFPDCQIIDMPVECINPKPTDPPPHININVTATHITVAPKHFCVDPGETVLFQVNGPPALVTKGSVTIFPKVAADPWMYKSNYPDESFIKLTMPATATSGADYYYAVVTTFGPCIDPRLHVR
jgi:hypothetical protein